MEAAIGGMVLVLVLVAGTLLRVTRRQKEVEELARDVRQLFRPRPIIEHSRMVKDPQLPGYAITLKLRNFGAIPIDLIEGYATSRFGDGEKCSTRWYPSKKRLRTLRRGSGTTIRFLIESRNALRIKWPTSVGIGMRVRRGLDEKMETWDRLQVSIDPGSTRTASLIEGAERPRSWRDLALVRWARRWIHRRI